ncbi:hypothetical protein EVAR_61718_1 [Eumeta japonica]|uniref:Uncharacterized protein n=1 Tax=Eumeta variegata TaxID=151549 RepID=A0A4C1ZPQ1_EUMVA|nr:hypothetical protein EVAR_61718_1 [Eumeta japonica]
MVKAFKIFGKPDLPDSDCANILNVNEIFDKNNEQSNDDMDEDEMSILKGFPEAKDSDIYQLPNHERCATHTLHLIPSRDIDKARSNNNSYRKVHDAAMAKCRAVWNLCARSPKLVKFTWKSLVNLQQAPVQPGGIPIMIALLIF